MSTSRTAYDVAAKAAEARQLLLAVAESQVDDDLVEILVDTETNLPDAITAALDRIATLEAHQVAIAERVRSLQERKSRFAAGVDRLRMALRSALETTQIKKMECASGTVSLRAVPRALVLHAPDDVPAAYRKQPPSVPDKTRILDAIKAGIDVPGAGLSNGGVTIAISSK